MTKIQREKLKQICADLQNAKEALEEIYKGERGKFGTDTSEQAEDVDDASEAVGDALRSIKKKSYESGVDYISEAIEYVIDAAI